MPWCKQVCLVFPVPRVARYLRWVWKKRRWIHQIFLICPFVVRVVTCTWRVRGVGLMLACGGKVVPPPPWLTSRLPPAEPQKITPPPTTPQLPNPICSPLQSSLPAPSTRHNLPLFNTMWLSGGCARCLVEIFLFRPWPKYSRSTKRGSGLRQNHSKHCWPTSKHWHRGSMQRKGLAWHRFSSSLKNDVQTFYILKWAMGTV